MYSGVSSSDAHASLIDLEKILFKFTSTYCLQENNIDNQVERNNLSNQKMQQPLNKNLFVQPNNRMHTLMIKINSNFKNKINKISSNIAECPTRPVCLRSIPPLDAAAATFPCRSMTIAPTVSNRSLLSFSV